MAVNEREIALPRELDDDFSTTFGRLQRLFRARGASAEDASDLAQATVERLLLHLRKHGLDERFAAYGLAPLINRIATNLYIDHYRANGKRTVPLDEAADLQSSTAGPEEAFLRRARTRSLRDAIDALPERYRRAIALSLAGMSPAEIAADFGIHRNAADVLLYRARRRLADRLRATGDELRFGIAIAIAGVRSITRRISNGKPADVTVIAGALSVQIVSAVLGLSLTGPHHAQAGVVAAAHPVLGKSAVAGSSAIGSLEPRAVRARGATSERFETSVRLDEGRMRIGSEVDDLNDPGNKAPLGVEVWLERDGEQSVTGTLLRAAIDRTCSDAKSACAPTRG